MATTYDGYSQTGAVVRKSGIVHNYVNLHADGGDTSVTRPSDWNEEHIIEDKSIDESKLDITSPFLLMGA